MIVRTAANAAPLSIDSEASFPNQQLSRVGQQPMQVLDVLGWSAIAKAVMADARPLQNWERQDAEEFFWSHLERSTWPTMNAGFAVVAKGAGRPLS